MTNFGKCETCRKRKVKCDEKLPTCGPCSKKARTCLYTAAKDSIFVHEQVERNYEDRVVEKASFLTPEPSSDSWTAPGFGGKNYVVSSLVALRLKRSHKAEHGGEFHTFAQNCVNPNEIFETQLLESTGASGAGSVTNYRNMQSSSPTAAMLCRQSQESSMWGSMFGYEALELNPLGNWVKAAWLWSGEDRFMDLASRYALESMRAFKYREQKHLVQACAVGQRALQSLQVAVRSQDHHQIMQKLVIAVMLHCAAEQFVNIGSFFYVPHVLGVSQLLKHCITAEPDSEIIRNVVSLICVDEIFVATFFGRHSCLENIQSPPTPLGGPYDLDVALFAIEHLFVKLPRLTCLVRSSIEDHSDFKARSEATSLAREVYYADANLYAQKTLELHTSVIPCSNKPMKSPMSTALTFESLSGFVLAARYNLFRVLLCGLIQNLDSLDPNGVCDDAHTVEQYDIAAATSLAMCLEYALKPAPYLPLTALGMLIPLQSAAGTWHRLGKRQFSTETAEYKWATRMKDWSFKAIHYLTVMWRARPIAYERQEAAWEMFAGGPLFRTAYGYERVKSIQTENHSAELDQDPPYYYWTPSTEA